VGDAVSGGFVIRATKPGHHDREISADDLEQALVVVRALLRDGWAVRVEEKPAL
jgi:hypothetical protein